MLLAPQKASFSAPEAGYVQVARAFRPRNQRMKIGATKPPLPRARPHETGWNQVNLDEVQRACHWLLGSFISGLTAAVGLQNPGKRAA